MEQWNYGVQGGFGPQRKNLTPHPSGKIPEYAPDSSTIYAAKQGFEKNFNI